MNDHDDDAEERPRMYAAFLIVEEQHGPLDMHNGLCVCEEICPYDKFIYLDVTVSMSWLLERYKDEIAI